MRTLLRLCTSPHLTSLSSRCSFLNLITRPLGGILADICYKRWGVNSKVYLTLILGAGQGIFSIAMGFWIQKSSDPSLAGIMIFIVIIGFFNEMANGGNYVRPQSAFPVIQLGADDLLLPQALVSVPADSSRSFLLDADSSSFRSPHINPSNNGVQSGLTGAFGNVGGIIFALIWRFRGSVAGVPWWCVRPAVDRHLRHTDFNSPLHRISGILALVINGLLFFVPKPKA